MDEFLARATVIDDFATLTNLCLEHIRMGAMSAPEALENLTKARANIAQNETYQPVLPEIDRLIDLVREKQ